MLFWGEGTDELVTFSDELPAPGVLKEEETDLRTAVSLGKRLECPLCLGENTFITKGTKMF